MLSTILKDKEKIEELLKSLTDINEMHYRRLRRRSMGKPNST